MQHDDMIQCTVQGCGRRQGVLLQVDVLCWARSLHKLFIIQLKGFAAKQNGAFKPLSKPSKVHLFFQREIWSFFSKWDFLKLQPKNTAHPTDSATALVESSETNTWQANLWSAGCFVIKPKYLRMGKKRELKDEVNWHRDGTVWQTSFLLFVLMKKEWLEQQLNPTDILRP